MFAFLEFTWKLLLVLHDLVSEALNTAVLKILRENNLPTKIRFCIVDSFCEVSVSWRIFSWQLKLIALVIIASTSGSKSDIIVKAIGMVGEDRSVFGVVVDGLFSGNLWYSQELG